MSWMHLLWIVPLAFALGTVFACVMSAGSRADEWCEMVRRREERGDRDLSIMASIPMHTNVTAAPNGE